MKPLTSLREIAKEAGVHFTTVSLALRNDPRLPQETRQRIQLVAERLGYHSNPLVSSLISNLKRARLPPELGVIAFLDTLSRPTGPYRRSPVGHPFYEGALGRARELGYRMDLFQLRSAGMTSRRMASILKSRAIRGLIIDSHLYPRGHLSMNISQFACVMRGYSNLLPRLHRVSHNHFQGILCAMHSLRHLGYRRIGLALEEQADMLVNNQWTAGYAVSQRRATIAQRVPLLMPKKLSDKNVQEWIDRHEPDVVLGLQYTLPMILASGRQVPNDIGFADLDLDSSLDKARAGIWQNMAMLGSTAVDSVTAQMQRNEYGLPRCPQLIQLEGNWRHGSSAVAQPLMEKPAAAKSKSAKDAQEGTPRLKRLRTDRRAA